MDLQIFKSSGHSVRLGLFTSTTISTVLLSAVSIACWLFRNISGSYSRLFWNISISGCTDVVMSLMTICARRSSALAIR